MSDRHVTFDMIVHAVSAVSGWSRREIMAAGRTDEERARLRYACWWLAGKMTELGPTTIGRLSGDRDSSTVITGLRRAEELRGECESFRASTDALLATLLALEAAGMMRIAEATDPLATARRVLAAPEREAVRVSTYEIIAMARELVALHGPDNKPTPSPFSKELEDAA